MVLIEEPVCKICGRNIRGSSLGGRCSVKKPVFHAVRSWGEYLGQLRTAVLKLKYYGDIGLSEMLARPMIDLYKDTKWSVDMIVPVPVGKTRAEERGYNQAALLAIPLSLKLGITYSSKVLFKTRDVKSQVGLSLEQRFKNVAGAFTASTDVVQNKSILLVDDVITSGATLNTCTKALIDAGALRVYGITLARSGLHQV